jgi:type IV pilus assembly protein PilA
MRSKLKKSNSEGFTIIEVMIVLVIAGLILLIVFLAVPALQRSARNTSRKSDVSALSAAVSEFINNNNGAMPGTAAANTTYTAATSTVTFGVGQAGVSTTEGKVGYYNAGQGVTNGKVDVTNAAAPTYTGGAANDYVMIAEGSQCGTFTAQAGATPTKYTTVAASSESFAVLYEIENGGSSYQAVCTAS